MPYLYFASFNRQGGTDASYALSTFSAQGLGEPGIRGRFTRVRLVSATIPWTLTNVDAENQTLLISETGGGEITATVPIQNYTASSLATALGTALTTASAGGAGRTYTCAFDVDAGLFSITVSASTFTVLPPAGGRLSGLNSILGFSLTQNSSTGSTVTGVRPALMVRYPVVYVHSSLVDPSSSWVGAYADSSGAQIGSTAPVVAALPSSTWTFGDLVAYEPQGAKRWHRMANSGLDALSMSLRDEEGVVVPLPSYWTCVLEVE